MSGDRRGWEKLPGEIRNDIVGYLPLPGEKGSLLAPVCREWQTMIEPRNFAEISLTVQCLADPNTRHILFRKRHYIRRICFDVQDRYQHISVNLSPIHWRLDPSARNAFESLFAALSTWEPRGDLVLRINGRSECRQWPTLRDNHLDQAALISNDESEMEWWRGLPSVPAVGVVLIHPAAIVQWNPVALSSMFTRFPNMKELYHEDCWRYSRIPGTSPLDMYTDERLGDVIKSFAGTRLRKLAVFRERPLWDGPNLERCNPALSRKLARASLHLKSLSASSIIDASHFFAARQADWLWERLTHLALTMNDIPSGWGLEIFVNRVFRDAAAAALYMPRLDTMELWNGGRAILFRYQKAQDGRSAVITVRGPSELPLEDEVIDAWEKVARRHRHGNLIIQTSLVDPCLADPRKYHSPKSVIQLLGLSTETARHVLEQQTLIEQRIG